MIEQKKNDWLATLFFSPDKTPQDLANLGITADNSSLQEKEYYKSIPEIQEAFKNESGGFDNAKFDKYYQEVLDLYNYVDNAKLESTTVDFYSYDPYDYFAPSTGKKRDVAPRIVQFANPERRSRGLANLREASAPTMSLREVAQQNKVFNYDTQKFEDWTPNDWGGLSAITRPTLVFAQWDEDGTHIVNGREVTHKAGDYKFDEEGDPFYETLGNRSLTGKDILHISDTLTVDGSKWNKYDFFDSDGLDKSVTGTIVKTLFKVGPMFFAPIGKVYGGLTAAIELGKLLPALYRSLQGIATGDLSASRSAQTATDIQAWFSRFDSSLSDRGKQGFFNLENLGKLVEDSSMQLFQQRAISKIPLWFKKKGEPISENAVKWGRGLALAYMAGTSSTDAYDAFKQAGASDRVAGLGMLSVMGAMFGLMNNDYFKDFWFRNTYLDRSKVRSVIKDSANKLTDKEFASKTLSQISTPKGAAKWVLDMQKSMAQKISNMKPGDLTYDAFNEGLEETIEELSTDAIKAFYSGLNTIGLVDQGQQYNFGITAEDMISRYFTSFIGGGIGGAIFSLHNKWESRNNPVLNNAIKGGGDSLREIVYLLREGRGQDLKNELNRLYSAGKLASTNLSGTEFEVVKSGDQNAIQYKPAEKGNSQNDVIYKQLNYYIDRINEVLKEEGLDISDNELQWITEQADILGKPVEQIRQAYLLTKQKQKQETITKKIVDSGLYSQVFEDWNDLTSQMVQVKTELENMLTPEETEPKTPKDIDSKIASLRNNSEYQRLRLKLDNLRAERNSIINGERNDYYTGQLLFAANPQLVNNFVSGFGIHNFTKYKYGKDYNTLTSDEKAKVDAEYKEYSASQEKSKVLTAYNIFTQMQEKMIPSIIDVAQRVKNSSGVYLAETTQYKLLYEQTNQTIEKKRNELDTALKALPEGVDTTEEIEKLRADIQVLETYLEGVKNFKFGVLNTALSESGRRILARPNWTEDGIFAFTNYATTYKDYLNYIKNNGLYLDLVDSDLASILQSWTSVNDLTENTVQNWTSRIQHELNSDDLNLEANDPLVEGLASGLTNIVADIKRNDINAAINDYEYIISSDLIDSAEELDITLEELIDKLLPSIGDDSFIGYLKDIKNLKSQISFSPAYDLIEAASKVAETDNSEVLDLIRSEQMNFLNSKAVEDYVIRDKNALVRLKETKQLIDAISAVLDASVEGGFNTQINPFRQQLQKELLPTITVEADINLVKDLNRITTQLQTLIDISERNQAQKLREQKDIAINMRQKFVSLLVSPDSLIKDKFASEFGINLEQLRTELNIPLEITEENYKDLEEAAIQLETAIFSQINKSNLSSTEIAQRLVGLFNPQDLISGKPTKLSKDPDTVITDFDQLIYLASIIATPSQNFYNELRKIISNPEFTNAPIFSQEYAVRVGYSQVLNKEIFNSIISQIKNLAETTSTDEYIQTKSPLNNVITIYGGAGVGKTKGVAYLLKLMLPKASIITSAPTRKQTDNLSRSIQHEGGSLTKNELIEKILGRPLQSTDIKPISNVAVTSDITIKVNSDNLFGDAKNKILFLDEVSWYNRIELELISKWARQNDVVVVALGDYKQNASFVMYENKRADCGVEDTYVVKTPDLIAPLRPDNIAKYDNYTRLAEALDKVYEQYYNDPAISPSTLDTFTKEYLNANKIEFKYFEDSGTFGGEKIVPEGDILRYIEQFKRLSGDVAVITDNPEKYNVIKGVKVVALNSVQGDEFDYVVIDKNFGLDDTGKGREDYYKLKDLYTLSQRSRKGTIIVNSGLGDIFTSKLDQTAAGNIEMPESQITDFRNWRTSLLEGIPSETITWEPQETSVPPITVQEVPPVETAEKVPVKTESVQKEPEIKDVPTATATTNPVSQTPYNPEPAPVTDIQEVVEPSEIKETTQAVVAMPAISPNDIVSSAESYIDFIRNDLFKYYKTSENSFQKYLGISNPEDVKKLTNLLRSYFVYGYYKTNTPELATRSNKAKNMIPQLVRSINPKAVTKVRELVNLPHQFIIVPYNQRGLLIARIGQTDIPLLITDPQIGEYYGDIELASKFKYITDAPNVHSIDLADFKNSEINSDRLSIVFSEPIVISASEQDLQNFDDSQKKWVLGDLGRAGNNGRTFFLVSNDPFIDDTDFRAFLEPVVVDNKVMWTTQHNDSIAIIGMNWVTDFETILRTAKTHSKNKHADSIINGDRAGQIIGIAYKVAPEIVTRRIKTYLKGNNDTLRVRVGNDLISNVESVDDILKKYQGQEIDITFGYIDPKRGFIPDLKGEWSINRVFENRRDSENFNQAQINEIDRLCKESPKFKQGIYARDIRRGDINGIYRSTDLGHSYITNTKELIGNDFKIDSTKINRPNTATENSIVDKLNLQLSALGVDRIISDQSNIESTIEDINKEILNSATTARLSLLDFDGENIVLKEGNYIEYMIANYLKVPVNSITFPDTGTLNFRPFYVSLQDQTNSYVAFDDENGNTSIREFPIIDNYIKLYTFLRENNDLIRNNASILKYTTALVNNQEVDLVTAKNYWNEVSTDPMYESVRQQVDEYLISKLMNNEC